MIVAKRMSLVHYGNSEFNLNRFQPVVDQTCRWVNKPTGGLWGSPVDSRFGWREWCLGEDFRVNLLDDSFRFDIEGNVFVVNDRDSMLAMPWREEELDPDYVNPWISFETMRESGVDAVHLTIEGLSETGGPFYGLGDRRSLYGWDCESVVVLNPAVIREKVKKTTQKC